MYLLDGQETNRLVFKKISLSYFNDWLAFFEDPETSRHWIFEKEDDPETTCKNWFARQFDRHNNDEGGMNALFEKDSNRLVGHCGLLKQTVDNIAEIEIAYSLLPAFWNKGYATEAAEKCKQFAFENNLASSLISIISLTNIPSEKVATKIGMTLDKTTVYRGNNVNIFRIRK